MTENERKARIFLNRLDWKTHSGDINELTLFQVDIYCFKIRNGLKDETAGAFTEYIKRLPMTEMRSVMKIFVWLYQHGVDFKLVFRYNPRLPLKYNLERLSWPGKMRKLLLANGHDDLMSCPLDLLEKEED